MLLDGERYAFSFEMMSFEQDDQISRNEGSGFLLYFFVI